ncbi:hypothetical protein BC629DRAFT_1446940 [Irpex lacteus]|nr:hypothetical protein BC629DRAFT_1446940 [Irpex lacteus]
MRTANFFFDKPIEQNAEEYEKMLEIEEAKIHGFERNASLVNRHAISKEAGVIDAYKHESPVVTPTRGKLITQRISGDLLSQEDKLLERSTRSSSSRHWSWRWELASDKTVYHFEVPSSVSSMTGRGIAQPNEGKLDLTLESPEIKRMRARCNRFVPGLSKAELDPVSPLVQERELRRKDDGSLSRIIHSYGQGGSGFTLSFGCAGDVISLVEEVAAGVAPTPMKSGN